MNKWSLSTGVLSAAVALLVGCSSERHVRDVVVHPSPSDNPSEQISALEKDMSDAREKRVNLLSPEWFASSETSLNRAKELRTEGGDFTEMFRELAEGRAQLQRANETAKASSNLLTEVMKAREDAQIAREKAVRAGATNLEDLNESYAEAEENFINLAKSAEDNKIATVDKNKIDVENEFKSIEVEATKKQFLDPARRVLAEAEKRGADHYAPKTLSYAQEVMKSAEKFIASSPKNEDEIAVKGKEVQFDAQRALNMTVQAKELAQRKPEETLLWYEQSFSTLGNGVGLPDMRNVRLEEQVATLSEALQRNRSQQTEVGKTNAALEKDLKTAERITANDAKFGEITKSFNESEAEVLRQGDKLIIRLKGIQFPGGEARLGPQNYELLGKVQSVIAVFPEAKVIVEGHTDSTGSPQINARISKARAEVVKQYLLSSGNIGRDKIEAVGMGFDRPVASNKTKEGRALNRRIDVVIEAGNTVAE